MTDRNEKKKISYAVHAPLICSKKANLSRPKTGHCMSSVSKTSSLSAFLSLSVSVSVAFCLSLSLSRVDLYLFLRFRIASKCFSVSYSVVRVLSLA